ncbi:maleylpyruvate isomerase family mycothiol-dependent enzyme [Streptomyces sp. 110]|uniref:Maleylpyruvate isomerase family mycothiol-dependent enzyme n=1 Tax=Streptomyces endocoffeicus TaxID=2898945 RepID=A0ABS1Q0M8_9ACTN|nr:maleylpyruvate isomerase family mycothiol-dependent enzyme [Streptomyces endocoffeicus]MBL1117930.1 maleylpyruvate isomerase family mycothiol-dependent enzyme [Streptomyces endocoffeicus]
METAELLEIVDREGRSLADAATEAGVDAPVPTCPGWRVRDLLSHIGQVHGWATRIVAEGLTERVRPTVEAAPVADAELVSWYREVHGRLVDVLTHADPEVKCFTFLPSDAPLAFWTRRQAHETAIHRIDAESARGGDFSPFTPEFAADGVDELLAGFHSLDRSRVRTDTPRTLRVRATDQGAVWTIRLSQDAPRTERHGEGAADCELSGPARDLYLALWNRLPITALTTEGDEKLAELWREHSGI